MPDPIVLLKEDHKEAKALLKQLERELAQGRPSARPRCRSSTRRCGCTCRSKRRLSTRWSPSSSAMRKPKRRTSRARFSDGLDKLAQLDDEPGFGATVAMLKAGINHHVKEEEQEVFPQLKKELNTTASCNSATTFAAAKKGKRIPAAPLSGNHLHGNHM